MHTRNVNTMNRLHLKQDLNFLDLNIINLDQFGKSHLYKKKIPHLNCLLNNVEW